MAPCKTSAVCQRLEVGYHGLYSLIRERRLPPPEQRDCSGHYLWSDIEVEAARQAIEAARARKRERRSAVGTTECR